MSATMARPSVSFAPVLEQKLKGRVTVEERPAHDIATLVTDAATLKEAAVFLRDDPAAAYDLFLDLASVDRSKLPGHLAAGKDGRFQANYILYSTKRNEHLRLRVNLPEKDPAVPSLTGVWPAANWFEREAWDLMG
ncbi:MAG TPA: NADH-quinone oxidoreductase subunit C, partial [Thermoanaerobaculia bacterium]